MKPTSGVNQDSKDIAEGSGPQKGESDGHRKEVKKRSRKISRKKSSLIENFKMQTAAINSGEENEVNKDYIASLTNSSNTSRSIINNDSVNEHLDPIENIPQKRISPRAKGKNKNIIKSLTTDKIENKLNDKSKSIRKNVKSEMLQDAHADQLISKSNWQKGNQKKYARLEQNKMHQAIISSPLEIALALDKIPALPPGIKVGEIKKTSVPKVISPRKNKDESRKLRMLISVIPGEQVEVGIAENDILLEYYLDMLHQEKLKGNIYKGVIHNIDINLQAAFVDFGTGKNGFLQIDEVHPEYWQNLYDLKTEKKKLPPIQKILKPGQELLVQVVKEPSGNKGAFLTTWLSLAGRFLVLTPGQEQIGVSRKVDEPGERSRLKDLMNGIEPGKGLGVIVRTAGAGATKTTLKNDLQYLKRIWKDIRKKATEVSAPSLIYKEPGLPERSVRDYLTEEIAEIWVDNEAEEQNVKKMVEMLFPRKKDLVKLYINDKRNLWDNFKLVKQLDQIFSREVGLPSGGRLVFDQTEALMAIDINSGKISGKGNFEAMAFKTNMEASEIIAHQLRLRDVGGQVVIDFIEMKDKSHIQEVEKNLRKAMKNDRARHDIARISSFGLLELVRQRMGSSALAISMVPCTACGGTGIRRNLEWQSLQCLRELRYKLHNYSGEKYVYKLVPDLGSYLLNYKREALSALEREFNKILVIEFNS